MNSFEIENQPTLVDVLGCRAEVQPLRQAYGFLARQGRDQQQISYAGLDRRARAIAAFLMERGQENDRVILFYPPGLEYIAAFLGCLYARRIAVPLYPPRPNEKQHRVGKVIANSEARIALTIAAQLETITAFLGGDLAAIAMDLFASDQIGNQWAETYIRPNGIDGRQLAFLQYTSGSTGTPKGVMVSHHNLMANERAITSGFQTHADDICLSWLPFYHDMGLIGTVLHALYRGFTSILMPSLDFIRDPIGWLEQMSHFGATISGCPNFGYDLCATRITPDRLAGLDLSRWRIAFNGAEPVRAGTLDRFARAFEPAGFSPTAFSPCYGMAEATLFISTVEIGKEPPILAFDKNALKNHQALIHAAGTPLVSNGATVAEHRLAIVHPQSLEEQPEGRTGEIWLAGPSVAGGYWGLDQATEHAFGARIAGSQEGPFLRTGDMGFFHQGGLFVTGRLKDMIIIRGRNYYPQDLELTAGLAWEGLSPDTAAAFAVELDDSESGNELLVVVVEVNRRALRDLDPEKVVEAIRGRISEEHELQAHAVILVKPGGVPKTSSGKVRRSSCRENYLNGLLNPIAASVFRADSDEDVAPIPQCNREILAATPEAARRELVQGWLHGHAAKALNIGRAALDIAAPLTRFGMDSMTAVSLQHRVESDLGIRLSIADFLKGCSIAELAAATVAQSGRLALPQGRALVPGEWFPLSYNQQAMWFLYRLAPESAAYNMSYAVRIRSAVDERLCNAFQTLVDRHPSLRTVYRMHQGRAEQSVLAQLKLPFEHHQAGDWDEDRLKQHMNRVAHQPFNLERGPLLRIELLSRGVMDHILLINMHHIASDFWSHLIFFDELRLLLEGTELQSKSHRHYGDFVAWQEQMLAAQEGEELWRYWQQALAGAPTSLDLPLDRARKAVQTYSGRVHSFQLDPALTAGLNELAVAEDATLYTLLLAALQTLLYRYSGQDDILIGSPVNGRASVDFEEIFGFFANTLVLRGQMGDRPSFRLFLQRTRKVFLDALAHQHFPFQLLVERLHPNRDASRSPLFQVMLVMQRAHRFGAAGAFALRSEGASLQLGDLTMESMALDHRAAQFDISLICTETEEGLLCALEYNSDLFLAATMARMAAHFQQLLRQILSDPDTALEKLNFATQADLKLLPPGAGLIQGPAETNLILRRDQPLEQWKQAAMSHPLVSDCAVLMRDEAGTAVPVVFVVGGDSPEAIGSHLAAGMPQGPQAVVIQLPVLPLTASGLVNMDLLAALPLVDQSLADQVTAQLQGLARIEDAFVRLDQNHIPLPTLHLNDLLPQDAGSETTTVVTAGSESLLLEGPRRGPAYADGGPLVIDPKLPKTLTQALFAAAENFPERGIHYYLPADQKVFLSYAELIEQASRILTGLRQQGLQPGQAVILQSPHLHRHMPAFWACALAGVTPVCVAVAPEYETRNSVVMKLFNIWQLLDHPPILSGDSLVDSLAGLKSILPMDDLQVLNVEQMLNLEPSRDYYQARPEDRIFYQLTSGSTGIPKCIPETHQAVIAHVLSSAQFCDYSSKDVSLNWLPMDHVVPILTCHLKDVYLGLEQVVIHTNLVLGDPLFWLDRINAHRVTLTWAPNFGYKLLLDALAASETRDWDLSCVRYFMNAGEQVTMPVICEFLERVAPYGVAPQAMQPSFGMAEVCTCMTYVNDFSPQTGARRFIKATLAGRLLETDQENTDSIAFVDLGPPTPGFEIRIADAQNRQLEEGMIGRFQIRGPSVMPGYYKNEAANKEAFVGDGWFNSGDLGFILDGRLTLTGREKEMIIVNGANFYCYEIEDIVNSVEGVSPTFAAVVGFDDPITGTEGLAVFFSPRVPGLEANLEVIREIRRLVTTSLGVTPDQVLLIPREEFPKTTSGKIQRNQLKTALMNGSFLPLQKQTDILLQNNRTLPDWFFRAVWRRKEVEVPLAQPVRRVLVFLDRSGLGQLVCQRLSGFGQQVVRVEPGVGELVCSEGVYTLDPQQPQQIRALLDGEAAFDEVLCLWLYDGMVAGEQTLDYLSSMIRLIDGSSPSRPFLRFVSSGAVALGDPEIANPHKALVCGLIRTVSREVPDQRACLIDLEAGEPEEGLEALLRELSYNTAESILAWRRGRRYVARLEKMVPAAEPPLSLPLRKGGCYLVTGGLGGVGYHLARYLLSHFKADLILSGRCLEQELKPAAAERLAELRRLDGSLVYHALDLGNDLALEQDLPQKIEGIFHLAGVLEDRSLLEETSQTLAQALAAKVGGSVALHRWLKGRGFFVHFSSINGFFGGVNAGAYSMAVSFQDAFAAWQRSQGLAAWSLAFSMWANTGMARRFSPEVGAAQGYCALEPKQGIVSMLAALCRNPGNLLIGLDPVKRGVAPFVTTAPPARQVLTAFVQTSDPAVAHFVPLDRFQTPVPCAFVTLDRLPRLADGSPDLAALPARKSGAATSEYLAPRDETEQELAAIWSSLLPVARIGVHQNFFELGGHSLLATRLLARVRDVFNVEVPVSELFGSPTIAALGAYLKRQDLNREIAAIPALPRIAGAGLPLSFSQERLWFLDQLDPGDISYNMPGLITMTGDLSLSVLEESFRQVIHRHEALRTTIRNGPDGPQQYIATSADFDLDIIDLSGLAEKVSCTKHIARAEAEKPFDLARGPLLRVSLVILEPQKSLLLVTKHHIISDGWSLGIMIQEIAALYTALVSGTHLELPPPPIQYADYALWQRQWLSGEVRRQQAEYWRSTLDDAPTWIDLPFDRPRPPVQTAAGATLYQLIPANLVRQLEQISARGDASLFMGLQTLFGLLLSRYSGQTDIVIGSPIANRRYRELESVVGFFVNTLALRMDFSDPTGRTGFQDLLVRVRQGDLEAYAHQDMPFDQVVQAVDPIRDMSRTPLFQVMFSLQNAPMGVLELPSLVLEQLKPETTPARFDLTLNLQDRDGDLEAEWEYNTDLFDRETIQQMMGHFLVLLQAVVNQADTPVAHLNLLTAEQLSVLQGWRQTCTTASAMLIPGVLDQAALLRGDQTALIHGTEDAMHSLTWDSLHAWAGEIAAGLVAAGVGPDAVVGLYMERCPAALAGILGILAAGAAYVPLDPAYPAGRLTYIVQDTGLKVVLAQEASVAFAVPEVRVIGTGNQAPTRSVPWPRIQLEQQHLAYVIYTSGSTGKPKGVGISHGALANQAMAAMQRYGLNQSDRVLQFAALNFDVAGEEIYPTWLSGGILALAPPDLARDLNRFGDFVARNQLSVLNLPAAFWHEWTLALHESASAPPRCLRILIAGSDRILPERLAQWQALAGENVAWFNGYGPTEATITATVHRAGPGEQQISIGRPLANYAVSVVDASLRLTPAGVYGELCIGGPGLARGYLGRPAQTAEVFVPDPLASEPGQRLYRTGDLAAWHREGYLLFRGRRDDLIKLRGFRIEPGEIEAVMTRHPAVAAAVVRLLPGAGEQHRLVGYLQPAQNPPQAPLSCRDTRDMEPSMRSWLEQHLPAFMIPDSFVVMPQMPLSASGKINRRALPEPDQDHTGIQFTQPRTLTEKLVAGIWAGVLGLERVGANQNFFESGGHSLLATRVISRLRARLSIELPLRDLFAHPTVAELAALIDRRQIEHASLPAIKPRASNQQALLSYSQERLWFFDRLEGSNPFYNMPAALILRGDLDVSALEAAVNRVITRHESLRTGYGSRQGQPVATLYPSRNLVLQVREIDPHQMEACIQAEALRPFDLEKDPLLRVSLVRLAAQEHLLLVTMHHIISDGWSVNLFVNEMTAAYRGDPLAPLPLQYNDFAVWQREVLTREVLDQRLDHWAGQLAGAPLVLELPTKQSRPPVRTYRGDHVTFRVNGQLTRSLHELAIANQTTLFQVMETVFALLISRYTGKNDFLIGIPAAGRDRQEIESLIGFFVNLLPIRNDLSRGHEPQTSFGDLLARTRKRISEAIRHQDTPFESIVERMVQSRNPSHSPLVQIVFSLEPATSVSYSLPGLEVSLLPPKTTIALFDLVLALEQDEQGLLGRIDFNVDLFQTSAIQAMARHFVNLANSVASCPQGAIDQLQMLDEQERISVLAKGQGPQIEREACRGIHLLVETRAKQDPDAVALVSGEGTDPESRLTYAELNTRANQLAHHLIERGVGADVAVAILLPRSLEMLVAILAVAKAGGAYLPLDPAYPGQRIAYIINDARAPLLIADPEAAAGLPQHGAAVVDPYQQFDGADHNPAVAVEPQQLIYIIYTSGSTGLPKGVGLTHQSLFNLVSWHQDRFAVGAETRACQFAGLSFDASVWEIWPYLTAGAMLHLVTPELVAQPEDLPQWFARRQITHAFLPTPVVEMLLEHSWPQHSRLKVLLTGGEKLKKRPDEGLPFVLYNNYGPTENTVVATFGAVCPQSDGFAPHIGRPIDNVTIYVLQGLEVAAAGLPGELVIAGEGLARGYMGRAALTAEKFIPDAFATQPGSRMYRTGDLVGWSAGDQLIFRGRLDHQVKLRGFRIETGEIEAVLSSHEAISQALVLLREDEGQARLIAYLVPAGPEQVDRADLVTWLGRHLPAYMTPSAFVYLEAFPLTPNGKINRETLPLPHLPEPMEQGPRNPTEVLLADIWCEVLGLEKVGVFDNFFELGGHSLIAARMTSRVRDRAGVVLPLDRVFTSPTIAELAQLLVGAQDRDPIQKAPENAEPVLSYSQERLWFLEQLGTLGETYHIPVALKMKGQLDRSALKQALRELVTRHEGLRLKIGEKGGRPVPVYEAPYEPELPETDLTGQSHEQIDRVARERAARPFDLASDRLFRPELILCGPDSHVLLVTMHHIVSDGWSVALLIRELQELYSACLQQQPAELPHLAINFADYAIWQRAALTSGPAAAQLSWWREKLSGAPSQLTLPWDRPRPEVQTFNGDLLSFTLTRAQTDLIDTFSKTHEATPFMTLQTIFAAWLAAYSGQDDLCVGFPVAGRNRIETEGLVGFFVNTLVLRSSINFERPALELFDQVRQTTLGALANQDTPFEQIVDVVRPERAGNHSPLFQVMFSMQNLEFETPHLPGLEVQVYDPFAEGAKLDLLLNMTPQDGVYQGRFTFNTDLFDRSTIERMGAHFVLLLQQILEKPDQRLGELLALPAIPENLSDSSKAMQRALLAGAEAEKQWHQTAVPRSQTPFCHHLIERRAAEFPDHRALIFDGQSLTYRQMNQRANALARLLLERGAGPEVTLGLIMDRCLDMLVSILAVWKTGACYVPFEPSVSPDRLNFMLADCAAPLIISQAAHRDLIPPGADVLFVDELPLETGLDQNPSPAITGQSAAYIIYTSGSTGHPKGALLSHEALFNHMAWILEKTPITASDIMIQKTPFGFDASVWELLAPLMCGGTLVLALPDGHRDPAYLVELMKQEQVTLIQVVPSLLRALLDVPDFHGHQLNLRRLYSGGEALVGDMVDGFFNRFNAELVNLYGPTETCIDVTAGFYAPGERPQRVTIGCEVDNTHMVIVDQRLRPVLLGVPGELCVAGMGLARGYQNRASLTAEKFVPYAGSSPGAPEWAGPGARLYRTGDLARRLPNGEIEYLGRIDQQIKLRGFRIEPGEIEAALCRHPKVREAEVTLFRDRLVAYLTTSGPFADGAEMRLELRRHLESGLPDYMIPTLFVVMDALPCLPNGKVNRRSLPEPDFADLVTQTYVAPRNEVEEGIARIWQEVLGIEKVGIHDNFFDLGGHSLQATQVVSRIREAFGAQLALARLFNDPTVAGLASLIHAVQWVAAEPAAFDSGDDFEDGEL